MALEVVLPQRCVATALVDGVPRLRSVALNEQHLVTMCNDPIMKVLSDTASILGVAPGRASRAQRVARAVARQSVEGIGAQARVVEWRAISCAVLVRRARLLALSLADTQYMLALSLKIGVSLNHLHEMVFAGPTFDFVYALSLNVFREAWSL